MRPLAGKLATLQAWATGLRREQGETRSGVPKVERGPDGRVKICPLADWSAELRHAAVKTGCNHIGLSRRVDVVEAVQPNVIPAGGVLIPCTPAPLANGLTSPREGFTLRDSSSVAK